MGFEPQPHGSEEHALASKASTSIHSLKIVLLQLVLHLLALAAAGLLLPLGICNSPILLLQLAVSQLARSCL